MRTPSSWWKLLRRIFKIDRRSPERRRSFRPHLDHLEERWAPAISVTGQNQTFVEGVTNPLVVATFTDTTPAPSPSQYTAIINWGDATSSAGVVSVNGGTYTVNASHNYADEVPPASPYTFTVTVTDTSDADTPQTGTATAQVVDAPLTPTGITFNPTETLSFSGNVGTFADENVNATTADFTANINWGDGTITPGTVSGSTGGPFTVSGTHTYVEDGATAVSISVADDGGQSTTIHSTAQIGENDLTVTAGAAVSTTEGVTTGPIVLATFTDNTSPNSSTNFSAQVVWGDGITTAGTVGGAAGSFSVTDSHTYADEINAGTYTVIVQEAEANFTAPPVTGTVNVAEADTLTASGTTATLTGTESASASGTVATFTDAGYPNSPASDFTAQIVWGDGATTGGSVTGPAGGPFTVSGTHTYTEDGVYHPVVTLTDNAPGTATAVATAVANIAEAAISGTVTFTPAPTEGGFTGTVATFSDPGSTDAAGNFTAQIVWGDGITTAGTVGGAAGSYSVTGSHIYADEGPQTVTVTLTETAASPAFTATATGSVTIAEGDVLTAVPATITPTEGVSTSTTTVATFTDTNATNVPGDFTATIDWGDNVTSTGGAVTITGGSGTFTVSGSHMYTDEGTFHPLVTLTDDSPGTASATATSTAVVAENDTLGAVPATITPTEGTSTGTTTVATFTDTNTTNVPGDFTATINWGDGTVTLGVVPTGPTGGPFTVSGSHTYLDEGTFHPIVTLTDDAPGTASAVATSTAVVAENDTLTATTTTATLTGTEGTQVSGTVATFNDAGYTSNPASDFTATVVWGDGGTDTGVPVTGPAGGPYTVAGTHTYTEDGAYHPVVTITDTAPGTATASATAVANIAESAITGSVTLASTPTEGTAFTGQVAVFTDPGSTDPVGNFTATIVWGDGNTSTGITPTSGSAGTYTVSGSNTYADELSPASITVTLTETTAAPPFTATATGTTDVAEGDNLAQDPTQPSPTVAENNGTATVVLAVFDDPGYPTNSPSDFTATIDWGDSTTTTGTVTGGSGTFTVSGSHAYADEGVKDATITLTDNAPGSSSATVVNLVTVSEADTLVSAGPGSSTATEGSTASQTVAVFNDTGYPTNSPGDFNATIDWGDGTTTTNATIITANDGKFTVTGSHAYADEGQHTANVVISDVDDDGSGLATSAASATDVITVAEGDVLAATASTVNTTEFQTFTGPVATFTTTYAGNVASDFTATIFWGDNNVSTGTVTPGAVGGGLATFTVTGSHMYFDEGVYTPLVFIADDAPGTATATATGTANVTEADVLSATGTSFASTEGQTFSGTVGTFSDTGFPANPASDFSAVINWGDGTSSAGTVIGTGAGHFSVSGSHSYADEGTFTATVVLSDNTPGSAAATATTTATVADADAFTPGAAMTVTATEGTTFTGAVATFTDTYAGQTAADLSATIVWGDTATTAGTVTGPTGGPFTVIGSHSYAEDGSYNPVVTITDVGTTAAASVTGTANVAEAAITGTVSFAPTEGSTATQTVATFSDPGSTDAATNFSATIIWGDGATTAGTVGGAAGSYSVTGSHAYADEGSQNVTVLLTETAAVPTFVATATGAVTVAEGDSLTAVPGTVSATEAASFSGAVATFTDTNATNIAGDFTATINWGDGTSATAGTVTGGSGSFTVSGSHTYADEGTFQPVVTLTDDAPGTASATATSTANVADSDVLSGTPLNFSTTEGQTFGGFVATFSDSNTSNVAGDFTATIVWGDNTTTGGVVTGGGGSFLVAGNHSYAEDGTYAVTVTLTDVGGTSSTVTGSAAVAEATITGSVSFAPTEGSTATQTVATFSDPGSTDPSTNFSATIIWGDGATTAGTVGGAAGSYSVTGSHAYADEGSQVVTVLLTENSAVPAFTATASGTVTVAEADAFTPGAAMTVTATEGAAFTGAVATFTDTYAGQTAADLSAQIVWGDGHTSAGTVTGSAGSFTVSGSNTYAEDGSFPISVTISDDAPGSATQSASATANVAEAAITGSVSFAPTEGSTATQTVATFSDPGSTDPSTNFSATIIWGDGATTAGTVGGAAGSYSVTGSHSYADEGSQNVTVLLTETSAVPTFVATATGAVTVAEGDTLTAINNSNSSLQEGSNASGFVARFTDTNTSNTASDFTATIDWGDGRTDTGTAVTIVDVGGTIFVVGSHTYADEGTYTITTVITDDSPGTASATSSFTVTATESDTLEAAASQPTVTATEFTSASGAVAVFSNTGYPSNTAADFTASINWGDGITTAGTVTGGSGADLTVSGSHTYTDEGTFNPVVTLTENAPGTDSASITGTAVIAEGDSLTAIPLSVNTTEGQTFSNAVAAFTDTNTANVAGDFTAQIVWGDGATTAGTVLGSAGNFTVLGSHSYADEGTNVVTVTLSDDAPGSASAAAPSTAYVAEGDVLTAVPQTFFPTEGATFTGTVASFTDTYTGNVAGDFTATIDWGDGTSTTGTVTGGGGTFDVSGSHAYADEGTFTATVVLTDNAPGIAASTALSTAQVSESDFGSTTPMTITPTEGAAFSGAVASFTDTGNPLQVASDFNATIDWGDGTTTDGTVSGPTGGPFTISGSHTYLDEGTFTVLAGFVDDAPGFAGTTIISTANVAEADTLAATATTATLAGTEGTAVGGTLATFTDAGYAGNPASDFTATIVWGDGATDTGVSVTGPAGGPFTVTGTHNYTEDGSFTPVVTIADDGAGTATATATLVANIAEAAITGAVSFAPTEGTAFSGAVATFSDPGSPDAATSFTAQIVWGDGATTGGSVTGSAGSYTVSGSHTYADEGSQAVTVTLTENSAAPAFTATASGAVTVAEGDALTPTSIGTATVTEGVSASGFLATFGDTNTANTPSDFTATINWGDGTTDSGAAVTITGGSGQFTVSGRHTYTDEGSFTAIVTLTDDAPGTASAAATVTVTASESDSLALVATPVSATEGTSFNGTVATFNDANAAALPGDFTVTILWGDGASSTGTVSGSAGRYTVTGTHTYIDEGIYSSTILVQDDSPGTATASAVGTVSVAENDTLVPQNVVTFTATEGTSFNGTVATFQDTTYPSNPASDFTATIDWGDGTTTTGTVSSLGGGFFGVAGNHTFADEGTFTATVVLTDDGHGAVSSTGTGQFNLADADVLAATGTTIAPTEGTTFSGTVATFTDTLTTNVASDFSASIVWGDGGTTAGTVTGSAGNFTVNGSHNYAEDGVYAVKVTIIDDAPGTAMATAASVANVAEASITGTVSFAPTENGFSGAVATFTDPGSTDASTNFSATIIWGDGNTTAGTVTGAAGSYTVSGSNAYADEGSQNVTVSLTETSAVPTFVATASGAITVAEGDALTAGPVSFSPTETVAFSGPVATFTDSNTGNVASDFTATIDWGDGLTTTGTVSGGSGTFTVAGSHKYAEEDARTVRVTLTDDAPGTASATASGTITPIDSDALSVTAMPIVSVEGQAFGSYQVATFTDSNTTTPVGSLSATIDWGDGTSSVGTISGSAGSFTVTGGHKYAEEATNTMTVTVREVAPGTQTASSTAASVVNEWQVISTSYNLLMYAGYDYSQVPGGGLLVGAFADPAGPELDGNGNPAPGEYSATVSWGDGVTTAGNISYNAQYGIFYVRSGHTYAHEGEYTVTLSVTHGGVSGGSGASAYNVSVGDAPLFVTSYTPPSGTTSFSGQVAKFVDYDLTAVNNPQVGTYTATIGWGDGTASLGTIVVAGVDSFGHQEFFVNASHVYSSAPTGPVTVTIHDNGLGQFGAQTYYDGQTHTPSGQAKSAGTTVVYVFNPETDQWIAYYISYN